jgi:hypothetical protein
LDRKLGGPRAGSDAMAKRKKILKFLLSGIEHRSSSPVALEKQPILKHYHSGEIRHCDSRATEPNFSANLIITYDQRCMVLGLKTAPFPPNNLESHTLKVKLKAVLCFN